LNPGDTSRDDNHVLDDHDVDGCLPIEAAPAPRGQRVVEPGVPVAPAGLGGWFR